jgi:hypothetical protein
MCEEGRMNPITGTVKVDGRLFARFALGPADPRRDYGATLSLKIWPVLDGQGVPGWFATYQRVSAAIHDRVFDQN